MTSEPEAQPTLFLLNSLTIGGSERKTVRVVNELHRRGCKVHVGYLNPPTTLLSAFNREIPVVCLGRKGKVSLKAVRALRAYIMKAKIWRIISVNLHPLLYAQAARFLLFLNRELSLIVLVNMTKPLGLKSRLAMRIYYPLMRRTEKIVFGCRAQLETWCSRYNLDENRCRVIYNGVDVKRFSTTSFMSELKPTSISVTQNDNEFVVGTVGQLRPVKNQLELIMALAVLKDNVPNARAVIVGDGSERARLERAAHDYGLDNQVSFLGEIDDVRPIVAAMDAFVLTSISETFSNAALEAMAMGKVVILSDTGGAREMVQNGINGYIYQQGNVDSLVAILVQIAEDPGMMRALGESARERVLRNFSFEKMIFEYQRLVQ